MTRPGDYSCWTTFNALTFPDRGDIISVANAVANILLTRSVDLSKSK